MKRYTMMLLIIFVAFTVTAQKFITKTGVIRFHSDAPIEKIEATNKQVNAAFDVKTSDFVFKVLIKSFEFEKALMQEHFNENYLESDKFPSATFSGKVMNIKDVDIKKHGIYPVNVEGKMTIHGVTKLIKEKGTMEIRQGALIAKSKFNIQLSDYNIDIPSAVVRNISKTVEITVECNLSPL